MRVGLKGSWEKSLGSRGLTKLWLAGWAGEEQGKMENIGGWWELGTRETEPYQWLTVNTKETKKTVKTDN
jgi:hypothetical protein